MTRLATRPPKRPGTISPSPMRTQADSPASSYRSTRPVTSLRQGLTNADIQAPCRFTKAQLYELYKNLKPTILSPKTTPKATRKHKHKASPRWTPPSSKTQMYLFGAPNSGTRPSASQGRAPDFADARPGEDPAATQLSVTAFLSAIPKPITQACFWPPPLPVPAPQPAPSGPVASQPNPSAYPSQLRNRSPGKCRATRAAKYSSASSRLQHSPPSEATILALHHYTNARPSKRHCHRTPASGSQHPSADFSRCRRRSLLTPFPATHIRLEPSVRLRGFLSHVKKLSSHILSFPEFSIAFSRFTEIICSVFPHRRRELNDYLAIIAELALSYGGGHFFTYHKLFSAKCAVRVAQWNQCPYWGSLDLDLHSRVFLGCRNIACALCRSVAHSTTNCPRINPSATTCPEPTSAKSTSYVPRPATVSYSDHEPPAPYAADNMQSCFSFNNQKFIRQRCCYLYICSFCGGASHSFGIWAVTSAAQKGLTKHQIQTQGRWVKKEFDQFHIKSAHQILIS